jgi:eukaryotic-like serine/threonine-protein kinase
MQTRDVLGTRYRLDQRIASGGMGDVWAARDELLGRRVALKLLHPNLAADEGFRRRFRAEAKAVARLSHPGIVAVYDYGEDTDAAYLAMELVDGEPLSAVIRRHGRLDPTATMSIVAQTADALGAAHAEGLVHRDVKPANLLLRPDGHVKVTDFGIVRATDLSTMTRDGSVLGTVAYMSPEQVRGDRATAASDLYALGVVAYECLTGSRPYRGGESIAVALAHLRDPVPPLPADVPLGVRQLVRRMLSKDPAARPAPAGSVARAARRLAAGGGASTALAAVAAPDGEGSVDDDVAAATNVAVGGHDAGPPTEPLPRDHGPGGPTDAVALAGLAEPRTMAIPPSRPVVFRQGTPRRQWAAVAAISGAALLVALVAAAVAGTAVPARSTVALPQLRGTALGVAEHRLAELGLHPSPWREDPTPSGTVVGERPVAGTTVPRGSAVTLVVRAPVVRRTTTTTVAPTTTQPVTTQPATTQPAPASGPPGGGPPHGPPPGHGPPHGHRR